MGTGRKCPILSDLRRFCPIFAGVLQTLENKAPILFNFAPILSDLAFSQIREILSGKSKWGLSNGGLRPHSAICAQLSTIVHFCGLFGPLSKGNFRHRMTTIVGNRGQLWTSALSPHLLSPHLDFPDKIRQNQRDPIGPAPLGNSRKFLRGNNLGRFW